MAIKSSDDLISFTPVTIADVPFNDPNADIVLCTADNVHFLVHKLFLSFASPFFKDLFQLPPPVPEQDSVDRAGRPIIHIAEDRKTIEMLLRFCYPSMDTSMDNLQDIQTMLAVMTKYDMHSGIELVRKQLRSPTFVEKEPLRVFAIAYRYQLRDEAIAAMKESIRFPLVGPDYSELRNIPASGYLHYLRYRTLCAEHVVACVDIGLMSGSFPTPNDFCDCSQIWLHERLWRPWTYEYWLQLTKALVNRTRPETATDHELIDLSIKALRRGRPLCPRYGCGDRAYGDLMRFATDILSPMILEAIAQVPLSLEL